MNAEYADSVYRAENSLAFVFAVLFISFISMRAKSLQTQDLFGRNPQGVLLFWGKSKLLSLRVKTY